MPSKDTYTIKPIKMLLEKAMSEGEVWVDPFCGLHSPATLTNDLNPDIPAGSNTDALDFLRTLSDESADGVLFDPPYSPRQVSECYKNFGKEVTGETTRASFWGQLKTEIARITKTGGSVISFGWNSGGIGNSRGFTIKEILLVAHGGWHNDTICTHEVKI